MKLPPSFTCLKKTTTEITTSKNNPQNLIFTNPGIIQSGFHLWVLNFSVLHNAGVKRAASAAPLERLVSAACRIARDQCFDFLDFEPKKVCRMRYRPTHQTWTN